MARRQGIYWLLTIPSTPDNVYVPALPDSAVYIRGQQELGAGGYLHWQVLVAFSQKKSLAAVRAVFGNAHAELSRSDAARQYVWKEDTRVAGTQFEYGVLPVRRNAKPDWDAIRVCAVAGNLQEVPSDIYVRCYNQLRRIGQDHLSPIGMERTCAVFWGKTGTGKSRRAWEEAGMDAFPKDPNSKFWDGYRNHRNVVIDEFRGTISISHLLRWLDRYPVIVEVKGSSVVLRAERFWITSNISPEQWYPTEDQETVNALLRRLDVTRFE